MDKEYLVVAFCCQTLVKVGHAVSRSHSVPIIISKHSYCVVMINLCVFLQIVIILKFIKIPSYDLS